MTRSLQSGSSKRINRLRRFRCDANRTIHRKGIEGRDTRMDNEIIAGIDIGTTKVCSVVASADEGGRFNVLGVGRSPSDGLTRGVVTNIDKTVRSIQSAVAEAESRSGIKIQSVIVGIAGDHIQSFQSRGAIAISRPENVVTQAHFHRLIEGTKLGALTS